MKKIWFVILWTVLGLASHEAQGQWALRGGYTYQYSSFAEVGVGLITKTIKPSHDFITLRIPERTNSIFLSSEFNFASDFVLGGKLGYEIAWVRWAPITARLSYAYYTDFTNQDMRVIPELGINLFGFLHLTYGYNIPLQNEEFNSISRNRISLIIVKDFSN